MSRKIVIIIGAGPAGLTAAYELLKSADLKPIILEASDVVGGISRTVTYRGNRLDIGGHCFFAQSETVKKWWLNVLPLQGSPSRDDLLLARDIPLATSATRQLPGDDKIVTFLAPDPERQDEVMLIRKRLSRIFLMRKFFDYPLAVSQNTIANLGFERVVRIAFSYFSSRIFPVRHLRTLEDLFINQSGRELYQTFYCDYIEKIWGVSGKEIPADPGAKVIKGRSLSKTIIQTLKKMMLKKASAQLHDSETNLVDSCYYPKYGPGQLWETVADTVVKQGGEIFKQVRVVGVDSEGTVVHGVEIEDMVTGEHGVVRGDYFISTMPVRDLIDSMHSDVPTNVRQVAEGLIYRDFITVGILTRKLLLRNSTSYPTLNQLIPDNLLYIHEPEVRVSRVQIFNNWSPYLVDNAETVWIAMEYFCNEGDELWAQSDESITTFAVEELAVIGVVNPAEVLDSVVIRVPKASPAHFGSYRDFQMVRDYLDKFANLFLIGRNGMHRNNNMEHSMLAAMAAVANIRDGNCGKENIWSVNAEEEYHKSK